MAKHTDTYQSEMVETFGLSEIVIHYTLLAIQNHTKKDYLLSRAGHTKSKGIFRAN